MLILPMETKNVLQHKHTNSMNEIRNKNEVTGESSSGTDIKILLIGADSVVKICLLKSSISLLPAVTNNIFSYKLFLLF
jgi:hypothetical protein